MTSGTQRTTTVQDPTGKSRIVVSDSTKHNRPISDQTAGRQTTFDYDSSGRIILQKAPEGDNAVYAYDARGNVTSVTRNAKPGSGLAAIVTSAAYPPSCVSPVICNKPTSTTDARLYTTSYGYDPTYGVLTSVTPPTGGSLAAYGYQDIAAPGGGTLHLLVTETHSAGLPEATTTSYGYAGDPNLLPTSVTTGGGATPNATLNYTYTSDGDVQAVTGPVSGMRTRYYYDLNRRSVGVVGPTPGANGSNGQPLKNRAVQTNFDGNGRTKSVVQGTVTNQDDGGASFVALVTQTPGYDAGGRATSSTVVAGSTTVSSMISTYDAADRPLTTTLLMQPQGSNRTTTNAYDSNGLLSTVTTATGATNPLNATSDAATVTYGYSANGKVNSIKDGLGNPTTYAYDGFDRLQQTTYADGTHEQLTYDGNSNVLTHALRDNVTTISFGYDTVNRVKSRSGSGAGQPVSNIYNYDTLGRLILATGGSYNVSLTWDALGHLIVDQTGNQSVINTYDAAGRRVREQWGNTPYAFRFTYLASGELTAITTDEGVAWASFGYDDLGRRTGLSYVNGRSTSYAYGADLRLSGLTHHMAAGPGGGTQNDVSYGYGYNPAGQITQRTLSNDSYAYAPVPTAITYGVDALNQLEGSATAPRFDYDARGNNIFIGGASGIARGYDADSKIVQASVPSQQPDILGYDALDRLASVKVGAGGSVTQLVWDGDELAAEADASGNVLSVYGHGPGTNEPVLWYQPSGLQVFHADERGSIVAVSDKSGNVERIHAYDAYGREGAAAHLGRFGYTGAIALPESGLVHMRARAYDPNLGRFVSADPIGVAGGINLYGYASGDPVNGIDPSGLADDGRPPSVCIECTSGGTIVVTANIGAGGAGGSGGGNASGTPQTSADAAASQADLDEIVVTGTRHKRPSLITRIATAIGNFFSNGLAVFQAGVGMPSPSRPTICQRRDWHNLKVNDRVAELRSQGWQVATNVSLVAATNQYTGPAISDYLATKDYQSYFIGDIKTGDASLRRNRTANYVTGIATVVGDKAASIDAPAGTRIAVIWTGADRYPGC